MWFRDYMWVIVRIYGHMDQDRLLRRGPPNDCLTGPYLIYKSLLLAVCRAEMPTSAAALQTREPKVKGQNSVRFLAVEICACEGRCVFAVGCLSNITLQHGMNLNYQLGHGHENSTEFRFTCVFGTRVQRNPQTWELMMACAVPKSGYTSSTAQGNEGQCSWRWRKQELIRTQKRGLQGTQLNSWRWTR